jgi:hypothetical protein
MKASTTLLALGVLVCSLPKDCQNVLNAWYDYQHHGVEVTCGNSDGNGSTYLSLLGEGKDNVGGTDVGPPDRIAYRRGDGDTIQCK